MSPRRRTQALNRRRRVSRISLSLQECDGVACSMHRGAIVMKHNNRLQTTCVCLAVASKQKSCRNSMPS